MIYILLQFEIEFKLICTLKEVLVNTPTLKPCNTETHSAMGANLSAFDAKRVPRGYYIISAIGTAFGITVLMK